MLYRVEIENFASICEPQVLDLRIGAAVPREDDRFAPIYPGSDEYVPKVIAIYGANASGKSNLLSALEFLFAVVGRPDPPTRLPLPFNAHAQSLKDSRIAIEFGGAFHDPPDSAQAAGGYRYELIFSTTNGLQIRQESLRRRPDNKGKWQRVFERDPGQDVKGSAGFNTSSFAHLVKTLRPDSTVVASFAHFQHPAAIHFATPAQRSTFIRRDYDSAAEPWIASHLARHLKHYDNLNQLLPRVDVGIESFRIADSPDGAQLLFRHRGLEHEMHWSLQSQGTRSFVKLFPLLYETLATGAMFSVDEIDASLHPLLIPEILSWFYDPQRNPLHSQLWFTAHNTTLLENLVKEQVVLCEKDRAGRTSIYSLMDVKSRRDDNLYRKYMSGAYGAVPIIG